MADLISASDEAVRHVVGRKVVAFLGQTEPGKSTFIHLVAGLCLRKDLHCGGYIVEEPLDGFVISRAHSSETTTLRPHLRSGGDTVRLDTPGLRLVASQRSPSMLFASIISGIDNFGLSTLFARLHPALESLVPEVTKTRAARKSTSPRRLRFRELRSDGDVVHLDTPGCDWGGDEHEENDGVEPLKALRFSVSGAA